MRYLEDNSVPILYNIYFKIDLNNDIYTGLNRIKLHIIKETNQIQFHAKDLTINKTSLADNNILDMKFDVDNDIYTIRLDSILKVGYYDLILEFSGKMTSNDGLVKYHHKLTNRTYIYSRFEPIAARKCYPCWDEPKYKVRYQTSIEINDPSFIVLSNTDPENIDKISQNKIVYKFAETIPMSSYLNSFIISKFSYIEATSRHNIRLRVYIPSDIKDTTCGDFALSTGIRMLDFMIDYYAISFPYNKIDFVPINDTSVQGMENYGLIFYDLDALLFDKKISTLDQRIDIAHVIAHELAHQWFGNLISINDWNNVWLKESFARFFQYLIVDNIFPEWDTISLNITKICKTLDYDSLCLKSIQIKHIKKDNIDNIYSKLTYDKGGLLLNILLKYIGEEQFKINIQKYLHKYKHTTVNTDLFIESICYNLNQTKQYNIRQLILQFLSNNGYPIIKCTNNKISFLSFNCLSFIKNDISNNDIFNQSEIINWLTPLNLTDNKYQIYNDNSDIISNHNQIINNKNYSYSRIFYDKEQFNKLLDNINNNTSHHHLSIMNDLYILGVYLICPFEYWLIYTNRLINLLLLNDDIKMYNYYLINMINSNINYVKGLITNQKIEQLLIEPMDKLINRLNKLFDVFNISQYQNQNLVLDNVNHNQIIFLLLEIKSDNSTRLLNEFFDRRLFNLYGDLNRIIIKRIVSNNDVKRLSKFNQIIGEFPYTYDIIRESLVYTKNKSVIDLIFKQLISVIDYYFITELLSKNEYFLSKFTEYFLSNYESNLSFYSNDKMNFKKLINELIINQTNNECILRLFKKIKNTDNSNITESKYTLFNILYKKNNIIKLINNLI